MSGNFSKPTRAEPVINEKKPLNRWVKTAAYSFLVLGSFAVAQVVLVAILSLMRLINADLVGNLQQPAYQTLLSVIIYALTIGITIAVPWLVRKTGVTLEELGLTRLPSWKDILLAPAGFVLYALLAAIFAYLAVIVWPGFNGTQAQDVGFDNLSGRYQYLFAFLTLVVIAPIAEEVLLRGYLYGKLRKLIPFAAAAVITSVIFGIMHLQWNVGINVFALSLIMCGLREVTGSIWAGILLHMMKNGIAFYVLFVNPSIFNMAGIL